MNLLFRDPYKGLGIAPDATEKEVRKAYRRLAMQYHPDRNPDDPEAEERFKQIQWAYETLVGTKKRISPPTRPGQYERPFSGDAHPFFGFFWAMRNYYARKKDSRRNE